MELHAMLEGIEVETSPYGLVDALLDIAIEGLSCDTLDDLL